MLETLEDLSNGLDMVTEEDAKGIIAHVNVKLKEVLNADIIDVLYKEEANDKKIIMRPLSSLTTPGVRDEAMPWSISKASKGIWAEVFCRGKIMWLENIKFAKENDEPVINLASPPEEVPKEHIMEIFHDTDSMLCFPLVFMQQNMGIFCIELTRSETFNENIINFLKRLSSSYSSLAWKVSAYRVNKKQTDKFIANAKRAMTRNAIMDHINASARGILLRPFYEEFNKMGRRISEELKKNGCDLQLFMATPGKSIIDELKAELRLAPYAVADITKLNPNVMFELGMVKITDKLVMLLRKKDDAGDLPFDIKADQVDYYEIRGDEIYVEEAGTKNLVKLDKRVGAFVQELRIKGAI